jgi:hypothetical protein
MEQSDLEKIFAFFGMPNPIEDEKPQTPTNKEQFFYISLKGRKPGVYSNLSELYHSNKSDELDLVPTFIKCSSLDDAEQIINKYFIMERKDHFKRVQQELTTYARYLSGAKSSQRLIQTDLDRLRQEHKESLPQAEQKAVADSITVSIISGTIKAEDIIEAKPHKNPDLHTLKDCLSENSNKSMGKEPDRQKDDNILKYPHDAYLSHGHDNGKEIKDVVHTPTAGKKQDFSPTWVVLRGRSLGILCSFHQYQRSTNKYPNTICYRFNSIEDARSFLRREISGMSGHYQYYMVVNKSDVSQHEVFKNYQEAIGFYMKNDQNKMHGFNDIKNLIKFIQSGLRDEFFDDYPDILPII